MDGKSRRQEILSCLSQSDEAISARKLAAYFNVSRQIIVGDIALLRASGDEVIATARGYKMNHDQAAFKTKIVVQHTKEQTRQELETIVALGGEVVDVIVEHDLYGEIVGNLYIKSQADVDEFIQKYEASQASLLLQLTNGIHLHTIIYQKKEDLEKIRQALAKAGLLYQE
ncbi:MAG TPA: transcription repressor NadR [Tetragenococcus sp.]|nr:transcription repressor NadR [Tetragenococcus sp.]